MRRDRRWMFLLGASCFFYMCWRAYYILLLAFLAVTDYCAALRIAASDDPRRRRLWLLASLASNLGLLFVFKYFNFFRASLQAALEPLGLLRGLPALDLLLPVGISFHTFQTMGYTIDVYRGKIRPERHFGRFALYVTFFPQLVAGPIERGGSLLPQMTCARDFDYERACEGLLRMLLGFFKKLLIADHLAPIVASAYGPALRQSNGFDLLLATYMFAVQIYCDFSGYSDIAVGAARLLGFDLMENFRRPYHAAGIRDFWSRWHISLSTWFRDYLYIPLGGSRAGPVRAAFNVMAVFLLSGLWHGANWTFVAWGAYHGLLVVLERPLERLGTPKSRPARALAALVTFHLVAVGWVLFRAASLSDALFILRAMAAVPGDSARLLLDGGWRALASVFAVPLRLPGLRVAVTAGVVLAAIHQLERARPLESLVRGSPGWARWALYSAALWGLFLFGEFGAQPFIYFQF